MQEVWEKLPQVVEVILEYGRKVIIGAVDAHELLFTTCVSRDVSAYRVNTVMKAALLQLRDLGVPVKLGQSVRYLVTHEASRDYHARVCVAERLTGNESIDVGFYLRQIAKCGESMLLPFQYSMERLQEMLHQIHQREKRNVSVLS
jgi:DNA polymerase elongation subunit (family B)